MLVAWAVLLVGALTWPLLQPGQLAARDMLVVDDPALSRSALGFGDLAARNVPQDGLLALVGQIMPASWFARFLIIGGACAGAAGAAWLAVVVRRLAGLGWSVWAVAAAMTIAVWNPLVVERALQGHWSLVIGAWVLPAVAAAGLSGRPLIQAAAVFLASLTPTGGLFAWGLAVATARGRNRWWAALTGLVVCLPWIIPGLLAASTASAGSAAAFAPRAEQGVGTLGALLGLGGIWNGEAVPASREAGFAVAGVVLFVVLLLAARRVPRVLLIVGALGLGGAVCTWLFPEFLGWLIASVPGAGLLRDGQKLVMLALPAYVALAAASRPIPAALVLVLAIVQVPDAPQALRQLAPVEVPINEQLVERADGRDVFFPDRPALTTRDDGMVIVDPATKTLSMVESGLLVVDGTIIDAPSPRWVAAHDAWAAGDIDRLEQLGIGLIVTPDGEVIETAAPARGSPLGLGLLLLWLAVPLALAALGVRGLWRSRGGSAVVR